MNSLYFYGKKTQEETFFMGNSITLYSNTDHLSDQTRVD